MKIQVRFLTHNGVVYLRKEDIIQIITELAATEETDTRNRLTELAKKLDNMGEDE